MLAPAIWWYVTRASSMVAWVLLVLSVLWGIFLATRVLKPNDNPAWLFDLHKWMGGLALVFSSIHVISLWLDSFVTFTIADLLIPFYSDYTKSQFLGRWPIALGVICFYLLASIQITSLLMRRLPRKYWKGIHFSSYLLVVIVSFHAGWTGSDLSSWAYRITALLLIFATTVALAVRILFPKPKRRLPSNTGITS